MSEWTNIDDILDFAIGNEEQAAAFYEDLATRVENVNLQNLFRSFAKEEEGHRARLLKIKSGEKAMASFKEIPDMKMADYLVEAESEEHMDYQGALILAMKREKAAFKLYTDLANSAGDADLKRTFAGLAQEEAKHKLRFELEYDQHVLREN